MERVIRLGVLNIVTQPHSATKYQKLLVRVRNRRKAGRIRGDRFGTIAFMSETPSPRAKNAFVEGMIATFTQIDEKSDWLNVSTGKKAESDELSELRIPKNLRPNLAYSRFRFYLREHVLMFEIGNSGARLTPNNAEKLFERLFSAESIIRDFGEVAVTAWPSKDTLNKILRSKALRSVHFVVHAPNPDDGKEAEAKFMKRLESLNARKIEQTIVAKKSEVIEPDPLFIEMAKIASKNGQVDAIVVHGGKVSKISTKDMPYVHAHGYSTEVSTEDSAFGDACESVRHQLRIDE